MTNFLDSFFNPRGIAIIGASSDPTKLGYAVARNLIESNYAGEVHLVNPRGGMLFARSLHKSITNVPDPVELAVIIVPAASAALSLREVGQRGIRAAILTSGGFRESGPQGAELEADVLRICQEFGIRLIGPNCVGLLDTHLPFDTTFLPPPMPARGDIAFLSHSGAFCAAVIDWSRGQGFGFSRLVSLGNQVDLTETDLLPAIASDLHTKTICLYLETIANGQKFLETARHISRQKPIVALKVGRTASGQKAAASHTGALAGSEAALNAMFEKAGVLRAASAEQLFDWARALSACPLPAGKKIAILTSAGGPGVIAADALETEGLTLAACAPETEARLAALLPSAASTHNPVDMLASGSPQQYADCLTILLADPGVDGALVITLPPPSHLAEDIADALIPLIQNSPKPVLVAQMGAQLTARAHEHFVKAGIPVYPFPERAASALGVLSRRAEFLSKTQDEYKKNFRVTSDSCLTADELVAAYGLAISPSKLAASPVDAARLAAAMTFPLVAKIASPDILHKSDINGVLLNLNSVKEVVNGYATLMERARCARPEAQLDGITIQSQIASGQEVIIGALRDPQFGVLMMFGSGGVEAEGLKDVAFALAPLNQVEAEEMLQKTWAGKKLAGFRNIPAVDRSAVIEALIRLSWLAIDHPEISEIEINPLRALSQGAVALDIRMKQS
jgi:acetyltransferase